MKRLTILFLSVYFLSLICAQQIKVDPNESLLIDQYGRYRIYHGVNVVYKTFPFYPPNLNTFNPQNSFSEQDASNLNSWGFNFIRLDVAWEGAEPEKDNFNMTYLSQIKQIVQICNKYNISVLLDAHQDLYSRIFCGEGFPDWVMQNRSFPEPYKLDIQRDADGYPIIRDCLKKNFFKYYYTYAVSYNSERIFTVENIANDFANFWQVVADYFKNEPNVLGYELINEPFGISPYKHPLAFFWPGLQNNKYLMPFYQILNQKIREVDQEKLVFFEPAVFDIFGGGFKDNIGGEQYKDREVFSYHIYCGIVNSEGQPISHPLCEFVDSLTFNGKYRDVKHLKIAGFLTEFGALGNTEKCAKEIDYVTSLADSKFNSWSYWQYKYYYDITTAAAPGIEGFYDFNGNLQEIKVAALSKPYAYAICGKPISTDFKRKTSEFSLEFEPNSQGCNDRNTELWLSPDFYYSNGFNTVFKNCDSCQLIEISGQHGYYQLIINQSFEEMRKHKNTITLEISPKK